MTTPSLPKVPRPVLGATSVLCWPSPPPSSSRAKDPLSKSSHHSLPTPSRRGFTAGADAVEWLEQSLAAKQVKVERWRTLSVSLALESSAPDLRSKARDQLQFGAPTNR
jgi:hypothetical protein